jgi:hypothetical protein
MKYILINAEQQTKTAQPTNNFIKKLFQIFNTTMQEK